MDRFDKILRTMEGIVVILLLMVVSMLCWMVVL
jgi:hypothetical protein